MGSKGRQSQTDTASPATEAPAPAVSAVPEQDTLGNSAMAERLGKPKAPESSMLLDAEGDWNMDAFGAAMLMSTYSASFFAEQATQAQQFQMINGANESQMEEMLGAVSVHECKRMFKRVPHAQRLIMAKTRSAMVAALDDDILVDFMFGPGTAPIAHMLTVKQVGVLASAEGGGHPKLARLMNEISAFAYDEAFAAMDYDQATLFLFEMDGRAPMVMHTYVAVWGVAKVGAYLDAASRNSDATVFDRLEELFRRLGMDAEVGLWYSKREGK